MPRIQFNLSDYFEIRIHVPSAVMGVMFGIFLTIVTIFGGAFVLSNLMHP